MEHPHLVCSSDTLGTFHANVSAYAASAQLQRFYQRVEAGEVNINDTILCRDECTSPPTVEETELNALLICVLGMAGIVVFLVLLIAVLIAVVIIKKR